jgi:DNA-binding CsgD family transcriptional regulator
MPVTSDTDTQTLPEPHGGRPAPLDVVHVDAEDRIVGSKASRDAMALLKLSHTPVEHDLYMAMLKETHAANTNVGAFSIRRLMSLTGLNSYSTIRRGRAGLIAKLSIDCLTVAGQNKLLWADVVYMVFNPEEIFQRRQKAGIQEIPSEFKRHADRPSFAGVIERVAERHDLSRREAQVALCCAEGLSNAEIGEKLFITEQTVKFHLRHIFIKFGVKRRAELIARLLLRED